MTGLLWRAIYAGDLQVTDTQAHAAEQAHIEATAGVLALERLLLHCVRVLDEHDVPVRVLKGTAVARLDYEDPAHRVFGDVDLLVRSRDFDVAARALSLQGYTRRHPEPRVGFDRRFSKGTSFLTGDELEIDLHRTFTMGPFGVRLDMDELWQRFDTFELAGETLTALATEERFLHSCYHAVLGTSRPRLVPLRDIAQIASRDLDDGRLDTLMDGCGGKPVVARAIQIAWSELGITSDSPLWRWALSYRCTAQEASELDVYSLGGTYAGKSWAAVRALPNVRDRAAYVFALIAPDKSYLEGRHSSRLRRLTRGLRQVQRSRHG